MHPVSHAEALARYQELPLPDTTEEHWRFTDLRGFDPDAFGHGSGTVPETGAAETMVDLDVAGLATITETGITIMRVVRALDAGPMLAAERCAIGPDDTSEQIERVLALQRGEPPRVTHLLSRAPSRGAGRTVIDRDDKG